MKAKEYRRKALVLPDGKKILIVYRSLRCSLCDSEAGNDGLCNAHRYAAKIIECKVLGEHT